VTDLPPRAAIVVVDDDPGDRATLERELTDRYGRDYDVRIAADPAAAMAFLDGLADGGMPVALVLAGQPLPGTAGIDLLARVHERHPLARRGLLVAWGDRTEAEPVQRALALGHLDHYVARPLAVPDEAFHAVVEAFLAEWAKATGRGFAPCVIVGDPGGRRVRELRDILTRCGLVVRVEPDPARAAPVVQVLGGPPLEDPSNVEIAEALGVNAAALGEQFDLAVVGAGPAGLAAAVYGASEGLRTLVIEREALGGQAATSSRIRNYLGFPTGIAGSELALRAYEQAWTFGAGFHFMDAVTGLRLGDRDGGLHTLALGDGRDVSARAVVLATGVAYRRLDAPGLDALAGAGVFYGASVSEAPAMAGLTVHVVGGGNSAGQAAVHLARYAAHVTILVRGEGLASTMSHYLVTQIEAHPAIAVRTRTELAEAHGHGVLAGLTMRDTATGAREEVASDGLFVLIGAEPHTGWLPPEIERDDWGYVLTGAAAGRPAAPYETSVPGVYAVGDVRSRSLKRVAAAVGEGSGCIALVHDFLAGG